jgi:hypothetical protein
MNEEDAEVARRFYGWKKSHQAQAENVLDVWFAAWRMGAWNAQRSNAQLGLGIAIQQLAEVLGRMERVAAMMRDSELDAELEAQSAYWKGECGS